MSRSFTLSEQQAREVVLRAQGLDGLQEPTIDTIKRLSYVQIDSISVAARAHHHVLFSRNADYEESHLDELVAQGQVFEYWSHAAAFLPMEDYRFSLYMKSQIQKADKFWFEKDPKVMRHVMRRIRKEGALRSKDFERPQKGSGSWFEWKPTKIALQRLFMEGKLMVSERQGFQKVYDLTENVLPEGLNTQKPTEKAFYTYLIDRAVSAQGIVTAQEMGYLRKGAGPIIQRILKEKLRKKELVIVGVEGNSDTYYGLPDFLVKAGEPSGPSSLYILNPFDNLVIQRKRLTDLFGFDYQIECYVPEAKRKHGYYTLPVLFGDRFVARLDPKVDRKMGVLQVKQLWFEEGFKASADFLSLFATKLKSFAGFCGCHEVMLGKVSPAKFKAPLVKAIKG